jgi:acyl carrier protein
MFHHIATDLYDPEQVLKAIETQKRRARPEVGGSFVAPRNPLEREMAETWAGLLGVEQVGVHDDFFKLGGNSILAVQLLSRVRESFGVEVPLAAIFDLPTVANLVVQIVQGRARQLDSGEMERVLAELEQLPDEEAGTAAGAELNTAERAGGQN